MVRTFGTGKAASDVAENGKRITWEEYVGAMRKLEAEEAARKAKDATAASPDGNGQPTEPTRRSMRLDRTPLDPEGDTEH